MISLYTSEVLRHLIDLQEKTEPESKTCQKEGATCQRQSEFFQAMAVMRKDDELCDATLNVDGEEIKVHKVWYDYFNLNNSYMTCSVLNVMKRASTLPEKQR